MFLFTSLYPFFSPNFERAIVNNIPIFRELSVYTNGHGVIIIGIIGSRFATLLYHSLVQLRMLQIQSMWLVDLQRYCNWFTKVDRVSDSCACAL